MDPLSFTASLCAVIGAAKVGAKGLRKIATYFHAPKEIESLVTELKRLEQLLAQTVNLVEDIDDATLKAHGYVLEREVGKASNKIDQINRLLATPHTLVAKLNDGKRARAIWMQNKGKIRTIQGDLKDAWTTINYALGILTAYVDAALLSGPQLKHVHVDLRCKACANQ